MESNTQIIMLADFDYLNDLTVIELFLCTTTATYNQATVPPQTSHYLYAVFAGARGSGGKYYPVTLLHPPRDTRHWLPPLKFPLPARHPPHIPCWRHTGIANKQSYE
ncbi:hypothetical protein Zmor_014499 [Zophobas morio]|uniref:Uncharacterized protein n=1 Tax=Zophobas morio TaxID=2755281 RepID=A0AA38IHI6_9CUCU|nr:hypothetical protein Zmor_014499 [Zophobas morio]